jgi:hypothetical protein
MITFVIFSFSQFFISDIITPPRLRRYSSYLKRRVVLGEYLGVGEKIQKNYFTQKIAD